MSHLHIQFSCSKILILGQNPSFWQHCGYRARTINNQTNNLKLYAHFIHIMAGEFGIVYKGCLAGRYTDEIVAIKTIKGGSNGHTY